MASFCGFTPQYEGLQALYEKYQSQGFAVLGFPCNQFRRQEPGTEGEIAQFCQLNYAVKFPLFAKIDVNGPSTHPLYVFLKAAKPGFLGTKSIKWNFTKFLIGRRGEVVERYGSTVKPQKIEADISRALSEL